MLQKQNNGRCSQCGMLCNIVSRLLNGGNIPRVSDAAIRFSVHGRPVGKGRARVSLRRGFAVAYTPAKTREFESRVRAAALQAASGPLIGPLRVRLSVQFCPPESWPRRRREAAISGAMWHGSKPDLDNVVKAVLDGMSGVAFLDDHQVVELVAQKRYGDMDVTHVAVEPLSSKEDSHAL